MLVVGGWASQPWMKGRNCAAEVNCCRASDFQYQNVDFFFFKCEISWFKNSGSKCTLKTKTTAAHRVQAKHSPAAGWLEPTACSFCPLSSALIIGKDAGNTHSFHRCCTLGVLNILLPIIIFNTHRVQERGRGNRDAHF